MGKGDKNSDHWRPLQAIEVVPKLHDDGGDGRSREGVYSADDMVEFTWEAKREVGDGGANRNEEKTTDSKREELRVFGERSFYWGWFFTFFD